MITKAFQDLRLYALGSAPPGGKFFALFCLFLKNVKFWLPLHRLYQ